MRVDELAQAIRQVDGNNSLGAGALAEALMPFVQSIVVSRAEIEAIALLEPSIVSSIEVAGWARQKLSGWQK